VHEKFASSLFHFLVRSFSQSRKVRGKRQESHKGQELCRGQLWTTVWQTFREFWTFSDSFQSELALLEYDLRVGRRAALGVENI